MKCVFTYHPNFFLKTFCKIDECTIFGIGTLYETLEQGLLNSSTALSSALSKAIYYGDKSSLQKILEIIKASFPKSWKHLLTWSLLPVTIETSLGKLSREYVILFIVIDDASEEGFSEVELALYLGP